MSANTRPELTKVLGRHDVLALAFGAMIGWGWVVLSGEMTARAGTVGSALAFVLGAVMVFLVGLTYAGIGPRAAYVCGWALVLAYLTVVAFEVVSLPTVVGYVVAGLNTGYLYTVAGWDVHLPWVLVGIAGALAIGVVNYFGIRMSSFIQSAAATTLFLVGLAFFIPGNFTGDTANLTPRFVSVEGFFVSSS